MSKQKIFYLLLFLYSCSRIEFATNWADTYVASLADHYFDTNSNQSHFIKDSMQSNIKIIRIQIYPRIALALDNILTEVENNKEFNLEMVNAHEREFHLIFNDSLKIFEPASEEFAALLSPKQLENYKKEFKDKTDDLKDDVKSKKLIHAKQFEKIKKQFENWTGSLSSLQKIAVDDFCDKYPFPFKEQIAYREKLSNTFVDSFSSVDKRKKTIKDLLLNYESFRDPDYAKIMMEYQRNYFEFVVVMMSKLSIDQKKKISITLKDRIYQLRAAAEKRK